MAIIRSSNSSNELIVDDQGAVRTALYDPDGEFIDITNPLPVQLSVPVTIGPGNVEIGVVQQGDPNTPDNAWPIRLIGGEGFESSISVTGALKVDGSGSAQPVFGSVSVDNFPNNQTVTVSNPTTEVNVSNFPATQPVSGTVSVANFPSTQNVAVISSVTVEVMNDAGNAIPISGAVNVTNFPATQPISGAVSVSNFPATQPISGNVGVSNFPALTYIEEDQTRSTLVGEYVTTTFRIAGLAASPHNLLSIWNPAASGKNIAVRRITLQCDHQTLLATNLNIITAHPTAQPTAGTLMAASKFRASQSASIAEVRGAASADDTASAITATAGTRVWSQFGQRGHTLAGWFTTDDLFMIPEHCYYRPIVLSPGDGLLVTTVANATTGARYVVNCWWTEYT